MISEKEKQQIIDTLGLKPLRTYNGDAYLMCCPFHNEKTPSCVVHLDKEIYYCFSCAKGSVLRELQRKHEENQLRESLKLASIKEVLDKALE